MSSNDKTADLLVATTRATKAETTPDASSAAAAPVEKKAPAKKAAAKKKAAPKKAPAKKVTAKKSPVKKPTKSQKETLVATFTFGRRVWPD